MKAKRLLVIQVAALGYDFLRSRINENWQGLSVNSAESVFPALTCPVQATLRTGTAPSAHGMVMNGVYLHELRKPLFWEQASTLVQGERLWTAARQAGKTVGLLFWQQSLGEDVDLLLSPAPIHTHGGGLVQDVYSLPGDLYSRLCRTIGKKFKLSSYWGPLASIKSSRWIADAVMAVMGDEETRPDLLLSYLPHLDYALQKFGPGSPQATRAFAELNQLIRPLVECARGARYEVLLCGDYAIREVDHAVFPNRILAQHGLLRTRTIGKRLYPDLHASAAFAVADHEVAHVYVNAPDRIREVTELFEKSPDFESVITADKRGARGVDHSRSGDLILTAAAGAWCAYPWWEHARQAPDYASHVDIHNKPGYDPCELFFGRHPFAVSTDPSRIKGSHGKVGAGREVAVAASFDLGTMDSLIDISSIIKDYLS